MSLITVHISFSPQISWKQKLRQSRKKKKKKLQLWNWGNYELYHLIEKQDHRTLEGKLELCKLISSFALHVSGRIKFQSLIGFVYIVYNQ